jgi:hypothetical protein
MMRVTLVALLLVAAALASACGSDVEDVASLTETGVTATPTPTTEPAADLVEGEAELLAFTQCMREQGIEYQDAVVNANGIIQRPQLVEGVETTRAEVGAATEACDVHIEGLTFGRERTDLSEEIDEFVALASCLREAGVEIDDPTAETLIEWRGALRPLFADPAFPPIFERCNAAGQ